MTLEIFILIVGFGISIFTVFVGRKDKSTDTSFKMGKLEQKVDTISKQLEKVLEKLDTTQEEIRKIAKEEIINHENQYHKGEK